MGKSIALISGIGGCGKTTISLLLTKLLSNTNKKVLYIDCDFSTFGATCFFERYIEDKDNILTAEELFFKGKTNYISKQILNIEKNIFFIPTYTYFPNNNEINKKIRFNETIYKELLNKYDVIIFDCQAGYSEINNQITKYSNKNLLILEANAMNSSATRLLHSQLSKQLDKNNTYQLFNKLTEEEYKMYSSISDSFLFTNIGSIKDDWNIKKSFVTMNLINIDSNPDLRNSLNKIIIALFPEYKNDYCKETLDFEYKLKSDIISQTQITIKVQKQKRMEVIIRFFLHLLTLLLPFVLILLNFIFENNITLKENMPILIACLTSYFFECIKLLKDFISKKSSYKTDENLETLNNTLSSINKNIGYLESDNN